MAQTSINVQQELMRRHRVATMFVGGMLLLTLLLLAIAFAATDFIFRPGDHTLPGILWIAIMLFGLGSFVYRRAKFAAMRLEDIAALRGLSGLLETLQKTTIQVAAIGGAIALMGFIVTIRTGNPYDMLRAAGVALIVLLYCYPFRSAWQRVVQGIERRGDANAPTAKGSTA